MKGTLATLAGLVCTTLIVPLLAGCGVNAQAESSTAQPLIASGGSALHVEREPRLASHPAAFGATHVSSEPLAGLVLFLALRAQQAGHSQHVAGSSASCEAQRPRGVTRTLRRREARQREGSCAGAG
jgi:hypothetical protein